MKRTLQLSILAIVAIFITTSCGNQQNKDSEKKSENILLEAQTSEGDITGIWIVGKEDRFMQFYEDGTYALGRKGKKPSEGNKYEIDKKRSTISLETKKGIKLFTIRFAIEKDEEIAYFKMEGKEKEIRYTKVDKRPGKD
ncbi:MAG: hypothetical protein U9R19_02205 [Bacteroidota bacterium]|nr:hypothetical protein [Bacteroidota bacterium]